MSQELKDAIRRLARPRPPVDVAPGCAFGHVVDQRLQELDRRLDEIKARVNGLLFLVAGAVVVEVVLRFLR